MVHALEESWRVLASEGRFVDLRPVASNWPLEVLSDRRPTLVGEADATATIADDLACNEAMAEVTGRGLFGKQHEESFEYAYYWASIDEMRAYIAEFWRGEVLLSEQMMAEARALMAANLNGNSLRIRRKIIIATYRRLG